MKMAWFGGWWGISHNKPETSPKTKSHRHAQLLFKHDAKRIQWERTPSLINGVGTTGYPL